jgi:hypothetical protein
MMWINFSPPMTIQHCSFHEEGMLAHVCQKVHTDLYNLIINVIVNVSMLDILDSIEKT